MSGERKIFTKGERELLHGILKGTMGSTIGVPIHPYQEKIQDILETEGVSVSQKHLYQIVFWKTNNQDVWWCIYLLVEKERPGEFEKLTNDASQPA